MGQKWVAVLTPELSSSMSSLATRLFARLRLLPVICNPYFIKPVMRIELMTASLPMRYSTTELHGRGERCDLGRIMSSP